jgi:hypothetical protein
MKKVKKSPTSPKGSRRGLPRPFFSFGRANQAVGCLLRDPLGDVGDFFTFFIISKHLFDIRDLLSSFQTFL